MNSEFESLWSLVETAVPNDAVTHLVCADWCDENGKPSLAYALRWCASHKKRPHLRGDVVNNRWQWIRYQRKCGGSLSLRKVQQRFAAVLPAEVFFTRGYNENQNSFPSAYAAYYWLGAGLADLRKVVEMPKIVLPPAAEIVRLGPAV